MARGPEVCLGHCPLLRGLAHLNQALLPLLLQPLRTLLQPCHLSISSLHQQEADQQAAAAAVAAEEEVEEGHGEEEGDGEVEYKKQRDTESAAAVLMASPKQASVNVMDAGQEHCVTACSPQC